MTFFSNVICPVSPHRIDENIARLTALSVLVLTIVGLVLKSPLLMALLAADFALRAFGFSRFSPLRLVAGWENKLLALPPKFTDGAPKRFAAGVGMLFSAAIALAFALEWYTSGLGIGAVLLACAFLESAMNFCVGCYVYTFLLGRWIPWTRSEQVADK